MSKVVGIDLGTTNSLVAYVKDGVPVVIRDSTGDALVPSVVSVAADGTIYVGREAQRRLLTDAAAHRVLGEALHGQGPRRRAGRGADAAVPVPGAIGGRAERRRRADRPRRSRVHAAGNLRVHPARAEAPRRGVLRRSRASSTPKSIAPSSPCPRTSTTRSARRRAMPAASPASKCCASSTSRPRRRSPTASTSATPGIIAVYDFGGGTFDISILRVEDGVFQVLSTNGDTHLGGDDIDRLLIELDVLGRALKRGASGRRRTPKTSRRFARPSSRRSWDLSERDETDRSSRSARYRKRITRAEFEALIRPIVDRTLEPCRRRWPTRVSSRRRSTKSCSSAARRASRSCGAWSASCSAGRRTAS